MINLKGFRITILLINTSEANATCLLFQLNILSVVFYLCVIRGYKFRSTARHQEYLARLKTQ